MAIEFVAHTVSIALICVCFLQFLKLVHKLREKKSSPPGSNGFPVIGETLSFLAAKNSKEGIYGFIQTRRARYGNCFRTNIFGKTHVFVSSIEAAKEVLGNESLYTKTYLKSISDILGEHSILCASKDTHSLIRHKIGSLLNRDMLNTFIQLFDKLTVEAHNNWNQNEEVRVLDDALKITFKAMCKTLISLVDEEQLGILQTDIFQVCEAMLAIPWRLPWTKFYEGLKARKRIMQRLRLLIHARKDGMESHQDFLQYLLLKDKSFSDGFLTDDQIQDNILTLIIAGQVTTASAIAWMVKYLDENQVVLEKLRDLQLSIAQGMQGSKFSIDTLNEMSYASKIVKETLRKAAIVSWFPMVALYDSEIEGFQIKKNWVVNVDARYIHNDHTVYENPMKFCPSRYDEDPKPYSFLAFGTGGRTCLGMNLAKAMMLVFLHRLVTTYRWEVVDHDTTLEKHSLFPRLRSGCPIKITPIGHMSTTSDSSTTGATNL